MALVGDMQPNAFERAAPVARSWSSPRRIAYVHEWLTEWGGSEDVVRAMMAALPGEALYAPIDFLSDDDRSRMNAPAIHTTFLQRLPGMRTRFWNYLPITPLAIETLDLSQAEVIVSSSHAFAKGVLTTGEQLHVSYVHSPMRYAWDLHHQYLRDYRLERGLKGMLARWIFHRLRLWDRQTANNVDLFVANSAHVGHRIWRTYRRPSVVLYPPVRTEGRRFEAHKGDYYVTVSRLVSYKRIDLIVEAFRTMPARKLVVIGGGPELETLRRTCPSNVELLGWQPDEVVQQQVAGARAFVFAALEDFGISPVEAQACGTPVIAYGVGGASESVRDVRRRARPTGLLFDQQTPACLADAVQAFESLASRIDPHDCRDWAGRFSEQHFRAGYLDLMERAWNIWREVPTQLEARMLGATEVTSGLAG